MHTLIVHFEDISVCVYSLEACADLNSTSYTMHAV